MVGMSDSQEQLLKSALSGDQKSLVALLEQVGPQVRAKIATKISSTWRTLVDEDDVMQVTYLEAVMRLTSFTGGMAQFVGWLTRMAENNLIDAIRSLEAGRRPAPSKQIKKSREESSSALLQLLGATMTTPSIVAAKGEAGTLLDQALRTLPPDYEKVLRMYDLEGKEIGQAAKELGRSEGAVFMLRARALDRLRDALGSPANFFSQPGRE